MHRLAATPGGWNPNDNGVVFIEQTPAPIVVLSSADTDIQTLAIATRQLPSEFPDLRVANLLNLQQQLSIDTYTEDVLRHAQVIVLRLLGGQAYWSYGLEVLQETVTQTGAKLIVLPGDDRPDPTLISHSTVPLTVANQLWRYWIEGGVENITQSLYFLAQRCLDLEFSAQAPQSVPAVGCYPTEPLSHAIANVGILFYRAHFLAGNTEPIEALCQALRDRALNPVPLFVSSLRDPDVQAELLSHWRSDDDRADSGIDLLLNATSFSVARLDTDQPQVDLWQTLDVPVFQVILSGGTEAGWRSQWQGLSPRDTAMNVALPEVDGRIITRAVSFKTVQSRHADLETDVVTYQSVGDRIQFVADLAASWVKLRRTLPSDRKIALILANYPTRDGRLANGVGLDTPASCVNILRSLQQSGYSLSNFPDSGDDLIRQLTTGVTNDPEIRDLRTVYQSLSLSDYQTFFARLPSPVQEEIQARWGGVQQFTQQDQEMAIAGLQYGNIFVGIQPARGYDQDPSLNYHAPDLEPTHEYLAFYLWVRDVFQADAIVHVGKHGNLEWLPGKSLALSNTCYPEVAFGSLPHFYPFIVNDPGEGSQAKRRAHAVILDHLTPPLTRAELYGGLQTLENLIDEYYEAQSLDPTRLSAIGDRILALINAEHLTTSLLTHPSPPIPLPTGEGSQTTPDIDPPLTPPRRETETPHSSLLAPHSSPNPPLAPPRRGTETPNSRLPIPLEEFITRADGYLCTLKEAQIRDGLHIFGDCPQGTQLRDLIIAIARHPSGQRLGLTRAIAQDWGLDIDPLTADLGQRLDAATMAKLAQPCQTVGDVVELLEQKAIALVDTLLTSGSLMPSPPAPLPQGEGSKTTPDSRLPTPDLNPPLTPPRRGTGTPHSSLLTPLSSDPPLAPPRRGIGTSDSSCLSPLAQELSWIAQSLLPALKQTPQELENLLHGLDGGYVPSGSSGAPTRGRPDVLPTGRNFYSVDIRAIPTESAWDVGRKAAETLIERYTQEQGEYPKTLGLSVWGTSTMRTGGDDIAEALALLGVRPVWDGTARRVIDFEILPLSLLGRPRVDVMLRISGFFRDAFPNLIDLVQQAVEAIAQLDEPAEMNPLAAQVRQDIDHWTNLGLPAEQAHDRAQYRIFGSKPGAYGAGLQGLIDAQNWVDDHDLARAYINWSSYAYTRQGEGRSAAEAFDQRLRHLQIVLHNQDNREHDLLDSDDYYQFQGGLTAAVRSLTGKNPITYFGDHAVPENPKVRTLRDEIDRVYRSRVVNPKWIAGAMRHGYKGAFELSATVDYLFAYDATTRCVEDFMYAGIANAYVLDPEVQQFVQSKNPWALRDMAERLLEAHQRQLWADADPDLLHRLRAIALDAEASIEQATFA